MTIFNLSDLSTSSLESLPTVTTEAVAYLYHSEALVSVQSRISKYSSAILSATGCRTVGIQRIGFEVGRGEEGAEAEGVGNEEAMR